MSFKMRVILRHSQISKSQAHCQQPCSAEKAEEQSGNARIPAVTHSHEEEVLW
jgi:hypothetical protein